MKLEVGKSYRNRRGEVVRIVGTANISPSYPFVGSDGIAYMKNGSFGFAWGEQYDLIAPADDPVESTVTFVAESSLDSCRSFGRKMYPPADEIVFLKTPPPVGGLMKSLKEFIDEFYIPGRKPGKEFVHVDHAIDSPAPLHPIVAANIQSRDRQVLGRDGKPARMLTEAEVAANEPREPDYRTDGDTIRRPPIPYSMDIDTRKEIGDFMRRKKPNPGPYPPKRGCIGER